MTLQVPSNPYYFVVATEAEKDIHWEEGSFVWVKATNKMYVLENKVFVEAENFVAKPGDTMTGSLTINPSTVRGLIVDGDIVLKTGHRLPLDG